MSEAANTWAPTPGPPTLAQLRAGICRYVLMPEADEALQLALEGIYDGIDRLNTVRDWDWTKESDTITFVAGTAEYGLVSQFKKNRHFEVNDPNGHSLFKLDYLDWKTYLEEHPDTSQDGSPSIYSVMNAHRLGNLSLNLRPTAEWVSQYPTGTLYYFRMVQYPALPEEPIDVPSQVASFLRWHGRAYMAAIFDPVKAARAEKNAELRLAELIEDDCTSKDWD